MPCLHIACDLPCAKRANANECFASNGHSYRNPPGASFWFFVGGAIGCFETACISWTSGSGVACASAPCLSRRSGVLPASLQLRFAACRAGLGSVDGCAVGTLRFRTGPVSMSLFVGFTRSGCWTACSGCAVGETLLRCRFVPRSLAKRALAAAKLKAVASHVVPQTLRNVPHRLLELPN